jgi:hypothetical protein
MELYNQSLFMKVDKEYVFGSLVVGPEYYFWEIQQHQWVGARESSHKSRVSKLVLIFSDHSYTARYFCPDLSTSILKPLQKY